MGFIFWDLDEGDFTFPSPMFISSVISYLGFHQASEVKPMRGQKPQC